VLILYGISIIFTVSAIAIYLGRSWQIGVALLVASVVLVGLVRFVGVFSHTHLLKRQHARVRSRDTELLRWALPELPKRFSRCNDESEILDELRAFAEETDLAAIDIRAAGAKQAVLEWNDGVSAKRRVLASLAYPLGPDANARATMSVSVVNDFEQAEMSPQTDILLQVLVDIVATSLTRVKSDLAPKPHEDRAEGEQRASSPALAVAKSP
jgi:UDP-GlcNAc:undecaprenyl-phosphate GlcNAc-1-phosphate transferase